MKWFEHYTDARFNPKIRWLVQKYGLIAYAQVFVLYEIAAGYYTGPGTLPAIPPSYDFEMLAADLRFANANELRDFCNDLAARGVIDATTWHEAQQIYIPKLAERADEWTKRKAKMEELDINSRESPEGLGLQDNTIQDK